MKAFWRSWSYLVTIAVVLWLGLQPQFTTSQNLTTTTIVNTSFAQLQGAPDINAIFDQVNAQRAARGIHPLERSQELALVAQKRADNMRAHHYYAHQNPSGEYFYDLLDPITYHNVYACENLDMQATLDTQTYVTDWLESKKGHRACMLNEQVTQAGYAVTTVTLPSVKSTKTLFIVVAIHSATPANTAAVTE